jgi:membrane-associated phospholipid phosphatase
MSGFDGTDGTDGADGTDGTSLALVARRGAGAHRPLGVAPSVAAIPDLDPPAFEGERWPPPLPPHVAWPPAPHETTFAHSAASLLPFRYGAWSRWHFAQSVLAELVTMMPPLPDPWPTTPPAAPAQPEWTALLNTTPTSPDHYNQVLAAMGYADVGAELAELRALAEYRPAVMAEAMAQRAGMLDYFAGILTFNRSSHPATAYLCTAALQAGSFLATHFKRRFDRPRPSRLSPALMPPTDPPGHPAYPSGHATQAHLIAWLLEEVLPVAVAVPPAPHRPLRRLASRIARNREVIGVHYPSDSRIGETLAERAWPLLKRCASVQELLPVARSEWHPRGTGP